MLTFNTAPTTVMLIFSQETLSSIIDFQIYNIVIYFLPCFYSTPTSLESHCYLLTTFNKLMAVHNADRIGHTSKLSKFPLRTSAPLFYSVGGVRSYSEYTMEKAFRLASRGKWKACTNSLTSSTPNPHWTYSTVRFSLLPVYSFCLLHQHFLPSPTWLVLWFRKEKLLC